MPSTSAVLEENNAGIKAQKGKRLSWRLSINRQINSLFPHRADQKSMHYQWYPSSPAPWGTRQGARLGDSSKHVRAGGCLLAPQKIHQDFVRHGTKFKLPLPIVHFYHNMSFSNTATSADLWTHAQCRKRIWTAYSHTLPSCSNPSIQERLRHQSAQLFTQLRTPSLQQKEAQLQKKT